MSKIYTAADQLIGNTPILELTQIKKSFELKAGLPTKLEYFNPAGSVKDSIAKSMIDEAERSGRLTPNSVIIEPTSGNTGMGLALAAAAHAAITAAKRLENTGKTIVVLFPDTGDRYLSTSLFSQ